MRLLTGLDALATLPPGYALSIGNFDGLHRGHAKIIRQCGDFRSAGATGVCIVTFEPHPLTALRPDRAPPRLAPLAFKRSLLQAAGVDVLIELAPEPALLNLSAEQFWAILRDRTQPSHLVEGETFTFGKDRGGTIARLREWTAGGAVRLHVVSPVEVVLPDRQIIPVSSSIIRWLVAHGRMRDASIGLGRPYRLIGPVVKGFQRGRTIGIPTANLDIREQLIPAQGVYAGRCAIDGKTYPAALSIGNMPTFGENPPQVEAYLIGFDGDLYGRTIEIDVLDWLRDQWRFNGVDALKTQIGRDVDETRWRVGHASEVASR